MAAMASAIMQDLRRIQPEPLRLHKGAVQAVNPAFGVVKSEWNGKGVKDAVDFQKAPVVRWLSVTAVF